MEVDAQERVVIIACHAVLYAVLRESVLRVSERVKKLVCGSIYDTKALEVRTEERNARLMAEVSLFTPVTSTAVLNSL